MKISFRDWSDLSLRNVKNIVGINSRRKLKEQRGRIIISPAVVANETTGTNGLVSFEFPGGSSLNMQAREGSHGCFLGRCAPVLRIRGTSAK